MIACIFCTASLDKKENMSQVLGPERNRTIDPTVSLCPSVMAAVMTSITSVNHFCTNVSTSTLKRVGDTMLPCVEPQQRTRVSLWYSPALCYTTLIIPVGFEEAQYEIYILFVVVVVFVVVVAVACCRLCVLVAVHHAATVSHKL